MTPQAKRNRHHPVSRFIGAIVTALWIITSDLQFWTVILRRGASSNGYAWLYPSALDNQSVQIPKMPFCHYMGQDVSRFFGVKMSSGHESRNLLGRLLHSRHTAWVCVT